MEYYFSKTINDSFENAIEKVTAALKVEGFGVLTEIDLKATLKKKLDVDFTITPFWSLQSGFYKATGRR
jgi:uncharacterized protein (DUF302 family)